eukprot:2235822-Prymnesium_polylepis.1
MTHCAISRADSTKNPLAHRARLAAVVPPQARRSPPSMSAVECGSVATVHATVPLSNSNRCRHKIRCEKGCETD